MAGLVPSVCARWCVYIIIMTWVCCKPWPDPPNTCLNCTFPWAERQTVSSSSSTTLPSYPALSRGPRAERDPRLPYWGAWWQTGTESRPRRRAGPHWAAWGTEARTAKEGSLEEQWRDSIFACTLPSHACGDLAKQTAECTYTEMQIHTITSALTLKPI